MEVSGSQLVVDKPPAKPGPPTKVKANDRSVWGQLVVGADDFAPSSKTSPARWRRGRVAAVLGALALAGGAIALWATRGDSSTGKSGSPPPLASPVASSPPPGSPALAAVPPPVDAAVAPVVADAGIPQIATTAVDAISGAAAPILVTKKPTAKKSKATKKAVTKKPVVTKKHR
jgi:hypothetical protein